MLEDDAERLSRFHAVIQSIDPGITLKSWRNTTQMIEEASQYLQIATLISLDHDLEPESRDSDPGDGYQLAKWLTAQRFKIPVIIHSSNGERASWMAGEFELGRWHHYRVVPIGDDWIETDWLFMVKKILNQSNRK